MEYITVGPNDIIKPGDEWLDGNTWKPIRNESWFGQVNSNYNDSKYLVRRNV